MSQPKLKVGDTFIYTRKMNEARTSSRYYDDCSKLIGAELTVRGIDDDIYRVIGERYAFKFDVIEPYLSPTLDEIKKRFADIKSKRPKKPRIRWPDRRKWKKVYISQDIEVSEDTITINGEEFTIKAARELFKKTSAGLRIWQNKYNKSLK